VDPKKISVSTFPVHGSVLNFFLTGDVGSFHFILWYLIVEHNGGSTSHPQGHHLSKASQSFNRPWQTVKRLRLCSPVSCFRAHHAETL
jgi:hypothetical protein